MRKSQRILAQSSSGGDQQAVFFSITDHTPASTILYVSPSCFDATGFEPAEFIGKTSYAFLHPDEHETIQKLAQVTKKEARVARMFTLRQLVRQSEGGSLEYIKMDSMVFICYDCTVVLTSRHQEDITSMRESAEDVIKLSDNGDVEVQNWSNRSSTIMALMSESLSWEASLPPSEPRFCLFLNRFTSKCTIQYATMGVNDVVGVQDKDLIGLGLYDVLVDKDENKTQKEEERVAALINIARTSNQVLHLDFVWQPNIKCEGVLAFGSDGILLIVRRK